MQIYDASTNSWSQGAQMPVRRQGAAAAAYNGKIYIFGGGETTSSNLVYEYDPVANSYTPKASMPTAQSQIGAATIGNRIYVVGGYQYIHYVYDPVADTWDTIAHPPIATGFSDAGAFAFNDELWVVAGYDNYNRRGYPPDQEIQIYNPVTNSWRFGPALNAPRSRSRAVGVMNGRGYVAGGVALSDENILLTSLESITSSSCAGGTVTSTAITTATMTATVATTGTTTIQPTSTRTVTGTVVATASGTVVPGTPASTATTCTITFTDVPEGSAFYTFVRCLACRGILAGYGDETFRPGNSVTRGQLSKIVANAAGFSDPASEQTFEDVPPASTFYLFVERIASRGIIGGYQCGGANEPCVPPDNRAYFRPNSNATRGQISKIVSNAAGLSDPPGVAKFEDVLPGSTFFDYVQRLANRGVIGGYACGGPGEPCVPPGNRPYFRPGSTATRGQTAKIVSNTFLPDCVTPSTARYLHIRR
jgi:hypothetical protein